MSAEQQPTEEQRERLLDEQAERERRQREGQMASSAAQQAQAEGQYAAPGYWDTISKLDFGYDGVEDDHIEDFLRIEGTKFNSIGNISYSDWEKFCWRIENELFARRNELQDNDKLDDIDVATMYGDRKPDHTNERESRLRGAERALKMQMSLAVGSRGLRSGTEIHAVARSEHTAEEDGPEGRLERAKEWLTS